MTQTQLELPPISFARYLELLKRRRWQVIPMTLIGLMVGVVAAFLIPRYYVGSTTLVYHGLTLDKDSRTQADPLLGEVKNAELSIPAIVGEALEKLEWIGTDTSDPRRDAQIEAVTSRLEVNSFSDDDRGFTNIRINYRDIDGERAAAFANTLRDTWVDGIGARVRERARGELDGASNQVGILGSAVQSALTELRIHAAEHGIDPRGDVGRVSTEDWLHDELREERSDEADLLVQVETLDRNVEYLTKALKDGIIPRYKEQKVTISENAELQERLGPMLKHQQWLISALNGASPAHRNHELWRHQLAEVQAAIAELAPAGISGGELTQQVENPAWQLAQERLEERRGELDIAIFQLEAVQKRIVELEEELEAMPEIYKVFSDLQLKLQGLQRQLENATTKQSALNEKYRTALTGKPFRTMFRASVPPAPTDPNLTVVVLTGGFFGLGAAIGLVLLLDFMRSTFKTVDDVQYALSVPVLGVMAFLETSEERVRTHRQRRRVSIAAATFLVLSLSLVTVYYLDPARLPPLVRNALDMLLGSAR